MGFQQKELPFPELTPLQEEAYRLTRTLQGGSVQNILRALSEAGVTTEEQLREELRHNADGDVSFEQFVKSRIGEFQSEISRVTRGEAQSFREAHFQENIGVLRYTERAELAREETPKRQAQDLLARFDALTPWELASALQRTFHPVNDEDPVLLSYDRLLAFLAIEQTHRRQDLKQLLQHAMWGTDGVVCADSDAACAVLRAFEGLTTARLVERTLALHIRITPAKTLAPLANLNRELLDRVTTFLASMERSRPRLRRILEIIAEDGRSWKQARKKFWHLGGVEKAQNDARAQSSASPVRVS